MNTGDIKHQWKQATDALEIADITIALEQYDRSVATSYTAVMHAGKAALAWHGITVTSHRGLKVLLAKHCVRDGDLEQSFVTDVKDLLDDRTVSEYGTPRASEDDARSNCRTAFRFAERMREYITKRGVPENELEPIPKKLRTPGDLVRRVRKLYATSPDGMRTPLTDDKITTAEEAGDRHPGIKETGKDRESFDGGDGYKR